MKEHHLLLLSNLIKSILIASVIILISLGMGMIGYHHFEKISWTDAYVNASMILSGMGPVSTLQTEGGKLFAGTYALFSGIIFLIAMALVLTPIFHSLLQQLHIKNK